MTIKVQCFGVINGTRTGWAAYADDLVTRADGALVIKATNGTRMGFRPGGWTHRQRTGDYDVFDVDFSKRFSPRKFA